jgi:hypothetical protein
MSYSELQVESMEEMAKRLHGCGSAEQVKAVIKAIKGINRAGGALDARNRSTALYHLAVALAGDYWAIETISDTAARFGSKDD